MDYNQTFSKEYKRIFKVKELEIKGDLKKFSSQSITHHRAMGTTMIALKKLREEQSESEYAGLFELFTKSQQKYSKNQIKLSLENDVFPEFEKLNNTEDHAFEIALKGLALITATDDIIYLLTENNSLTCLMYQTDSLDLFELKDYGTPVEYTDLHKKLNATLYPEKLKKQSVNNVTLPITDTSEINCLSDLEKAFLFYFMCDILSRKKPDSIKYNLPATELARINVLCNIEDSDVFSAKYANSKVYRMLSEGLNYNPPEAIEFIGNLVKKLKALKLKETIKYLTELQSFEYAKSIKNQK